MGCLDLSFLLITGMYSDIHLACTGKDGSEQTFKVHRAIVFMQCAKLRELALESPIHYDETHGVDVVHLDLEPETLEGVLSFLYSGEYCVIFKAPETQLAIEDEGMWDDANHSLFYSLRVCAMALDLELPDLFAESAAALCAAFKNFTFHVDLPAVLDELYSTLGKNPRFVSHLMEIPRGVARDIMRSGNVKKRLESVVLKHPNLAVDILEATMDALAEAKERLQHAEEELGAMYCPDVAIPSIEHEDEKEWEELDEGRRRRRSESDLDDEDEEEARPLKRRRLM
ncbi:hypothetical protein CkaCkLH20_09037 [Colletotrichum karsti]|uniref:BTB domain-containing protein n=1 Tax=Colletotrichum karsti TaxID=1095194 RepID=A0A9P6HXY9_9PEZI|nr:uncharacterized protein CkaCkLH20_09037 [Colletotrichum karsti]KAF9873578.1 hypothetical protein CkaCkLH20_09037 [Colletotrichum karsti]